MTNPFEDSFLSENSKVTKPSVGALTPEVSAKILRESASLARRLAHATEQLELIASGTVIDPAKTASDAVKSLERMKQ